MHFCEFQSKLAHFRNNPAVYLFKNEQEGDSVRRQSRSSG